MKKTRRTKMEIMTEILKVCCNGGVNKTKIVYSTNLNFKITDDYLKILIEKGYISITDSYRITDSGKEFLNKAIEIQRSFNSDRPALNGSKQNGDKPNNNNPSGDSANGK